MNILVCIKQVPDNAVAPTLDAATNRVRTEGIEPMVSPFDLNALEAALKIMEEKGGEVSVITMGDEASNNSLKIGLAMGAEKAYLVSDPAFSDSDTLATAYVLSKAIESIGPFDMIFCGKQAIDGDNAQVGAQIAEYLNIPQITYVDEIKEVSDDKVIAKRVGSSGEEIIEASLPVLLTCEKSLNEPRYPTLKRTRKANRTEIPVLDNATLKIDLSKVGAASACKIQKLYMPEPRQSGEILKGEAAEIGALAVQKIIELKIV